MKRLIIILALSLVSVAASAQYIGGAKYKDIKNTYDPQLYTPSTVDPYSPALSGVWSFFVPGVGQMLSGEPWRGLAFFGGSAVLAGIIDDCRSDVGNAIGIDAETKTIYWTDRAKGQRNLWIIAGCTVADLGIAIWSSIDARRIAKVKNMYYQDKLGHISAVEMNFAPSLAFSPTSTGFAQPAPGLAFTLAF